MTDSLQLIQQTNPYIQTSRARKPGMFALRLQCFYLNVQNVFHRFQMIPHLISIHAARQAQRIDMGTQPFSICAEFDVFNPYADFLKIPMDRRSCRRSVAQPDSDPAGSFPPTHQSTDDPAEEIRHFAACFFFSRRSRIDGQNMLATAINSRTPESGRVRKAEKP